MTNDQPKAAMSAEQYIKTNGYRFEVGERMIMLKLLKDFAAQTCADKQAEIDKWQADAAKQFRQLQLSKEETKRYKEAYHELVDKYEELKASADKMLDAFKLNQDYKIMKNDIIAFRNKHIISAGLHSFEYVTSQAEQTIQQYESIDKGNTK